MSTVTIADLRAKVGVDGVDKMEKDLHRANDHTNSIFSAFTKGFGTVSGALSAFTGYKVVGDVLGFVKDQFVDLLQAGMDQQAVEAQTAAAIKSTGGAAHLTKDQVGDLADSYAKLTGVSDDTIQSAENILLTFTDIKSNVFPQTTGLVLDLAQAMHEDLNSAALQIGKALQDPIQGVTALRRVGVQLADQQAHMVEQFVKTGQKAKAQQLIIGELTREVGGSAEAFGKTLPGQLAVLNVKFDQAKEKIGLAVIPILQKLLDKYVMPLADWLGAHLPAAIDTLTTFLDTQLLPAIDGLVNSPVVKTVEGWALAIVNKFIPSLDDKSGMAHHTNKAKAAVAGLDKQTDTTTKNMAGPYVTRMNTMLDKVDGMTTSLGGTVPTGKGLNPAIMRVNDNLGKMDKALDTTSKKQAQANQQSSNSIPVLSGLGDAWGQVWAKIQQAGGAIDKFVDGVKERFPDAQPIINDVLGGILQNFADFGPGLGNVLSGLAAFLSAPFRAGFDLVEGIVFTGMDLIGGHIDKAGQDIKDTLGRIWNDIQDMFAGLGRILVGIGQTLLNLLALPFKTLWATVSPFLGRFKDDFGKFWNDLPANVEKIISQAFAAIQQFINDHIPHFPGISIPWPGQQRASGGSTSGDFLGAERGMELLVTPGIYHAPPGSYVYNAQDTQRILNGGGSGSMRGGNTYITNVYPHKESIDANDLAHIQRRRDLLLGMY